MAVILQQNQPPRLFLSRRHPHHYFIIFVSIIISSSSLLAPTATTTTTVVAATTATMTTTVVTIPQLEKEPPQVMVLKEIKQQQQRIVSLDVNIFEGTYFQHMGKVVFAGKGHFSVLSFNTSILSQQLSTLRDHVQNIKNISINFNDNEIGKYFFYKIDDLANTLERIKIFYDAFLMRLGNNYGADDTFKLVTKEHLNTVIEETFKKKKSNNVTFINQLISHMDLDDFLQEKIKEERNLIIWVYNMMKSIFSPDDKDNTKSMLKNTTSELILAQAVNFIYFASQSIEMHIDRLITEIENMIKGRVSSFLLPPEIFQKDILEILQDRSSLPYPASATYLPLYYSISRVVVRKIGEEFYFIIRIPLQMVDEKFSLYKCTSFWFYSNDDDKKLSLGQKIRLDNTLLAVRNDFQYFVELSDLSHCTETTTTTTTNNNDLRVCIPTSAYTHVEAATTTNTPQSSCLISLFKQNQATASICHYDYLHNFPTSFIKVSSYGWLISSHKEFIMNEICPEKKEKEMNKRHSTTVVPSGISSIVLRSGCLLSGDGFMLPAFDNNNKNDNYEINIIMKTNTNTPNKIISNNNLAMIDFNTPLSKFEINYAGIINEKMNKLWHVLIGMVVVIVVIIIIILIITFFTYQLNKNHYHGDIPLPVLPTTNNNDKEEEEDDVYEEVVVVVPPPPTPPPPLILSSSPLPLLPLLPEQQPQYQQQQQEEQQQQYALISSSSDYLPMNKNINVYQQDITHNLLSI